MPARLEHVNIAVPDPDATASILQTLFGWHIRWSGASMQGYSVHVGTDDDYVALYAPGHDMAPPAKRYRHWGGLNHIGVVVDDLDAAEARVKKAGFKPASHADYEPGKRFYFDGPDGVEYEVVSYS
ncbi:VOC family protein [Thalassococcus sp. CAU 1522]|uniref:VOC family protein n=1 Tax=Thalassococcus arenae TaxID=2851652 RepID=A0ABS6NB50_9RHOB|nr:VOC family protein [Thalassococcus arenae]MBV2361234.1 VOC family protein [Thalassococcus arenae]